MAGPDQNTATAPGGVVHQLADDDTMTRCGLNASTWSRAMTRAQELGLVVFCADCEAAGTPAGDAPGDAP